MRRNWKRTSCLFIGAALLIGLVGLISSQSGSHAVAEDPPPAPPPRFVQATTNPDVEEWPCPIQDFPALLDTETGLMWGKELTKLILIFYVEEEVTEWADSENFGDDPLDPVPDEDSLAGGYTDWRPATMTEILQAKEAGMFDHQEGQEPLYDFSYLEGIQGANDLLPLDDPYYHNTHPDTDPPADGVLDTWGEKWHVTSCVFMQGRREYRWWVRCGDGSAVILTYAGLSIPVRGAPPNHDDCPHKHKGVTPDNPGLNK